MPALPDSFLGHYKILSKIGAGGMGEVFLAEDIRLNRKVALKVLPETVASDKERLRRFEQEARAASALNHPNILTIFEFGFDERIHFLATELIEGETLREALKSGELSLIEKLKIAEQIAFALSSAHAAGIVHRDLKPENIMIRRDGIIKILDFGLAKLIENKATNAAADAEAETRALVKTNPGVVMGTVAYMSPEQARGKETDARTDVWSLGVLIFEMVCNRLPFAGETTSDVIASILKTDAPLLSNLIADAPPELEKIVGKCLRKNADERYQNVKDLQIDLKDLREDLEFQAKLERSTAPNKNQFASAEETSETQIFEADKTDDRKAISTKDVSVKNSPSSSAEYIAGEIKQHKRGFLIVLSILLFLVIGFGYWFYANRSTSTGNNQINSIAILPFENSSGDAGLDYLSDGLSESLIDKLSQLPQLKVIARSSSFKFRGGGVDLQDAAAKLGVRALVTGKIARVGDNLTVRVEMIDTAENRQLWSEQYNRKTSDLLSIQQEIAQTASEKLRLKLSGAQERQLAKRETANPQAYELVLKGRFALNGTGTDNIKDAVGFMKQAVAADPNYALAYAELADKYVTLIANSLGDPKEYLPPVDAATRRALELDENLPEAHLAMSRVLAARWQWQESEAEKRRALELDPNNARFLRSLSALLANLNKHDEAIALARRAKELDPLSLFADYEIAYRLCFARRFDESIFESKKALANDPNVDFFHVILGYALAGKGQFKEAIAAHLEAARLGDKSTSNQVYLGAAYARAGERGKATEILKQLQTTKEYVSPGELAILYGALGDKEAAFRTLEQAFVERDLQLSNLNSDPAFDPLRDDPRFQDLIRRVGLPL